MKTMTAAALATLLVGMPAGYIVAAVTNGSPPAPATSHAPAMDHAAMGHDRGTVSETDASRAFREAATKMHADMSDAPTGDVDVDFAQGMLPHHQGAIDMARIEMKYGKDPEMRRLAKGVLDTQQREIESMRGWLARKYGE